ncbi:MAG: hypothetical protein FWC16_07580 [Defluviitaleaceae bacterium]|nr:hypothetical protein [Defluviitaleaceae bacterium]MCL2274775.1 hypothetical protein [Defluviitaleaceae bacterium]
MLKPLGIDTWKEESLSSLAEKILSISPKPLVLVDGKGGSGKTSFAVKLGGLLNANLVASDDVAWWADPIHWDGELNEGIIQPWRLGENVEYIPSGWVKKSRKGCIAVDANKALIVEGSGACRKTLRNVASFSIWVDADPSIARARVIRRDLANGENGGTLESVTAFTDHWDAIVDPFLAEEEAWKYVNAIISGTQSDLNADRLLISWEVKMLADNNTAVFAKIEEEAKTYLKDEHLQIALDLLAYLRESGRTWIFDYHPEFYYMDELNCLFAISKSAMDEDTLNNVRRMIEEAGNRFVHDPMSSWNLCFWQNDDDLYEPDGFLVGEEVKEFARQNVWKCIHCGGCDASGGSRRIVFGKEYNNACCNLFQFTNPDIEMAEHIKKLMELQKRIISARKRAEQ